MERNGHPRAERDSLAIARLDDPQWLALLGAHPHDLFSSLQWCRTIAAFYGFRPGVVLDGSKGGLPFAIVDDHRGVRHVVYPFSDGCAAVGAFDLDALEDDAARTGRRWVVRGPDRARASVAIGVLQDIDLAGGSAALAARSRSHRKHLFRVRHALRAGVALRVIDEPEEAVDHFYPLYSAFRKERLRLLPQGRAFFAFLAHAYFPKDGFVIVAELEQRVVGVAFLLLHDATLFVKYSATDYAHASLGIGNALIQASIEAALERGCTVLDLGLSTTDSLREFKTRIGARSRPVYRTDVGPASDALGADVDAALHTLTELSVAAEQPLSLAQGAGAALYRYFA